MWWYTMKLGGIIFSDKTTVSVRIFWGGTEHNTEDVCTFLDMFERGAPGMSEMLVISNDLKRSKYELLLERSDFL